MCFSTDWPALRERNAERDEKIIFDTDIGVDDAFAQRKIYRWHPSITGGVLMRFLALLIGPRFYALLQHGREIESAVSREDTNLLNHSTPELERYFSRVPTELPRQNAFPVATVFPLMIIVFAFNLLPLLHTLPGLTPQLHALSFFVPSLVMIVALIITSVLLARGFTAGLTGFMILFLILLAGTVVQAMSVLFAESGAAWPLGIAALAILGCRWVFNSQGFMLFTLYCRTQRLAIRARKMRLKSR